MAPPVELSSAVGVKRDDIDYGPFRKWLKPIWVRATVHPDLSREPCKVGEAFGFIIRRLDIRERFHELMEVPHRATRHLAFALFDRYGRLKEDIRQHVIRKGSGVWREDLDDGNIVLVENVSVEEKYQRQGIGTKLVLHLLQTAMASQPNLRYAFTCPEAYYPREEPGDKGKEAEKRDADLHRSKVVNVARFFRSLQFRRVGLTQWFALARDEQHMSRHLPSDADPDPMSDEPSDSDGESDGEIILCGPGFTQTRIPKTDLASHGWGAMADAMGIANRDEDKLTPAAILRRRHPLHYAIKVLGDSKGLEFLKLHTNAEAAGKLDVEATDGRGDTIMHVAAKACKPLCLVWIRECANAARLSSTRNHEGYTPLEALEAQLENQRIQKPFGWERRKLIADKFDGFDDDSVSCFLILRGVEAPTAEQREMAKFGCSCGKCLAGFLSPRMLKNLRDEAETIYDFLRCITPPGGNDWYLEFKDMLVHLPDALRRQFRRNIILQTAFILLVDAVIKCLADSKIPNREDVRQRLKTSHIWPDIENHYFLGGGTVAAVVNAIIDRAKDNDIEFGESLLDIDAEEWFRGLAKCRNDQEYEFVRRHCTDDAPPKEEDPEEQGRFQVDMPWLINMFRLTLEGKSMFQGA